MATDRRGAVGIELAVRHRTRSVVAISPSGLGLPAEWVHQGILMATARTLTRTLRPLLGTLASTPAGRTALLAGIRTRPWEASEREALTHAERVRRCHRILVDAVVGGAPGRAVRPAR